MSSRVRPFSIVIAACSLLACTEQVSVGSRDATARHDGGAAAARTDECGNGLDDDRNGQIDDGCFCSAGEVQPCFSGDYPGRDVGLCRDGMQRCEPGVGIEFGDWGDFACTGETLPVTEACNDVDDDCDGATDESCPCDEGQTRGCGTEFVRAPCTPGAQACRGGAWSACEDAIGPSADVCEDAIDNDCDGTVNEGCTCRSEPERCADGVDNDCDGTTDEVACTPRPDAGMPDGGTIDGGVPECTTAPERCVSGPGTLATTGAVGRTTSGDGYGPQLATDGTHLLVMDLAAHAPGEPSDLRFVVLAADGTMMTDVLVETGAVRVGDLVWTGSAAALVWWAGAPSSQARYAVLRLDGTIVSGPAAVDPDAGVSGGVVQAAMSSGTLAFAWARYATTTSYDPASGWFQRRNADGSPSGPLVNLGAGVSPTSMEGFETGFIIGTQHYLGSTSGTPQFQSQVHQLVADAVTWSVDLPLDTYSRSSGAVVAASCDRIMACWRDNLIPPGAAGFAPHIQRCQAFDASGNAVAAPTVLLDGERYGNLADAHFIEIVWAEGQFLVRVEASYPASFMTTFDTHSEWYVALADDASISWTRSTERRGEGFTYDYGDLVWDGTCAVELMHGVTVHATTPGGRTTYDWRMRRTCTTSCP